MTVSLAYNGEGLVQCGKEKAIQMLLDAGFKRVEGDIMNYYCV